MSASCRLARDDQRGSRAVHGPFPTLLGVLVCVAGCGNDSLHALPEPPPPATPPEPSPPTAANLPPVAVISLTPVGVDAPMSIFLDGSASYDPDDASDGALVRFAWRLSARPAGSAAELTSPDAPSRALLAADLAGPYVVELVVTDKSGAESAPASQSLTFQSLTFSGDCVTVTCAPSTPYPVGCSLTMSEGEAHGCIASAPQSSQVYIQEGRVCEAGWVSGAIYCAAEPQQGLNATTCPINKPIPVYTEAAADCPH
jgi:hypothetical protein